MPQKDLISDAMLCAILSTLGGTVLAVPFVGFGPVLVACGGLIAVGVAFRILDGVRR